MTSSLEGIQWSRLLGRPLLPWPSPQAVDAIQNERVLVTGAGGSIGSALALRLAILAPRHLLLMESSEAQLFALQSSLREAAPDRPQQFALGNVLDYSLLEELFDRYRPGLVFHAAAYKHVPLLEEQPFAALENNIFGTETIVTVARRKGARVLLLSTDKAVEPASIMGAAKRVAEMVVLASGGTVVRLGNVLATSGSVAEVFEAQIAAGGPVTVTEPAARRYFLTVDEAVHLLIGASAEPVTPSLFVPGLNAQHSIADLARFMAGELAPGREIAFEFSAQRPGDKALEKLLGSEERIDVVYASGLQSVVSPGIDTSALRRALMRLRGALDERDLLSALDIVQSLVPDYTPSTTLQLLAERQASRATP